MVMMFQKGGVHTEKEVNIQSLRELGLDEVVARQFAVAVARRSLSIYENSYPGDFRPRLALETSLRYSNFQATTLELSSARALAWQAVKSASTVAQRCAARACARASTYKVLDRATMEAAKDARKAKGWMAYKSAGKGKAGYVARIVALEEEEKWQINYLKLILDNIKTG